MVKLVKLAILTTHNAIYLIWRKNSGVASEVILSTITSVTVFAGKAQSFISLNGLYLNLKT